MAAPRFLAWLTNRVKMVPTVAASTGVAQAEQIPSTNTSGFLDPTLINATTTSAGAADAGKPPLLDSSGRLDPSVMPVGIGSDTASLVASEALTAGNVVNVWLDAGTPKMRKADATAEGKEAHGFVLVGVAAAATGTIYYEGRITGLVGLTAGARYFLQTTPGTVGLTAPSAAGNVAQIAGIASNATELNFEPQEPVTIA